MFQTDLTPYFREARALAAISAPSRPTPDVLDAIARSCGGTVDWEPPDDEWGRVLKRSEVIAYVCVRVPLIISTQLLAAQGFVYVQVSDLADASYRTDRSCLESIFGRALTTNIDYDKLSIADLWWATV